MKKILVTGGAGFIGSNLIKILLHDGYEVYSLDNYSTGSKDNHVKGAYYIDDDINNINLINQLKFKIDFAFTSQQMQEFNLLLRNLQNTFIQMCLVHYKLWNGQEKLT